ncbi:signal peptide peptidase-domain-containing protein [Scenedesmus sp. NREL 46B-D3]|nr:signal peptide peptidase-domain-containing protein [Scenedesmus sp. NREL 46B-D3]
MSIDRQDGLALLDILHAAAAAGTADSVLLQLQLLEVPALDASALLLWILAVGTVVAGSLWSGADYALELKGSAAGCEVSHGSGRGGGLEILEISAAGAVGFVLFSSGVLVLLYFFLSKAFFYVILVGFSLAGAQALGIMLLPAVNAALPRLACRKVALPFGWGHVSGTEVAVTPVAVAVAVTWAVARNASWSWVLQDVLGVAVMLLVLRTLRLPDLRVACVLLPLCFCYDVFWVFLQPMLTGGGTSVMVEVAGGGDSHEFLPMLLRGAYSLLGFGDVILPGMLVALTRRLDIAGKTTWHGGYYVASVMGYGAGLLLTYVALMFSWFGDEGQPALLYLVPCTLGVVLVLAVARGELRALLGTGDDDAAGGGHEYEAVGNGAGGAARGRAGAELVDEDDDGFDAHGGAGCAEGEGEDAPGALARAGQGADMRQAAGGVSKPAGQAGAMVAGGADGAFGGRAGGGRQQRARGRGHAWAGRPEASV